MKFDVTHVAKLANLHLSDTEKVKFEKELGQTLDHIENLNEVDTQDTDPTTNITGLENILREDVVKPSLSQDEALQNAKSSYKGFFKVKGILDNE